MTELTLKKVWRAKYWLFLWTLLGAAAGIGYATLDEPTHEAAAKLLVERAPAPLDEREPDWERNFMPTQAEIASSPTVVGPAADQVWNRAGIEGVPLKQVLANLQVSPLVGANVLSIRYRHTDPDVAAEMIDAIIEEYTTFLLENEREHRREALIALEAKAAELSSRERALLEQRNEHRRAQPMSGIASETARLPQEVLAIRLATVAESQGRRIHIEQQLRTLRLLGNAPSAASETVENGDGKEVRLTSLELPAVGEDNPGPAQDETSDRRLVKSAEMSAELRAACIDLLWRRPADDWVGLPDAKGILQQISEAKALQAELATRFGPKHRELLAAQSRVNVLEAQLDRLVVSVPDALFRELERATEEERLAELAYEEELGKIALLDEVILEDGKISDELERVRVEQAQVAEQLSGRQLVNASQSDRPMTMTVRVLEEPSLMPEPLAISSKVLGALGAGFGLLAGLLLCAVGVRREST